MGIRAALRILASLVVLAALGSVAGQELVSVPTPSALPGSFVTLPYTLNGQGTFSYSVAAPESWQPLKSAGEVDLRGRGLLSVTLKVPPDAPAGSLQEVSITLTPVGADAPKVEFVGRVRVELKVALDLTAPPDLAGEVGRAQSFTFVVANRGNMQDEVHLTGSAAMFDVRFDEARLILNPGERIEISATLLPLGSVSHRFRALIRLTATSGNDESVTARTAIQGVFLDPGIPLERAADAPPRLTLWVDAGARARVDLQEGEAVTSASWVASPRLSGDLSDFTSIETSVGRLAGSLIDPFEELPSELTVALDGGTWSAGTSLAPGSYSAAGGGQLGDWRVGAAALYHETRGASGFGLNVQAVSLGPELDLQLAASTALFVGERLDALNAQYRRKLMDDLQLHVAAGLVGLQSEGVYTVTPIFNETLSWQDERFYATQSYSGNPVAGVHHIGLSGGMRGAGLFSVRASTLLRLSPSGDAWRNTVTLASRPAPGLSVQLEAGIDASNRATTWRVSPSLGQQFRVGPASMSAGVSYTHTGTLSGPPVTSDRYRARASLTLGRVSVAANAGYFTGTRGPDLTPVGEIDAGAETTVRFGLGGRLTADYRYKSDLTAAYSHDLTASWAQEWSESLTTRAAYSSSSRMTHQVKQQRESLSFTLNARDLLTPGFNAALGYSATATAGLFTGVAPPLHSFSVGASYALRFSFDTPPSVVELFGGRDGVLVTGTLFRDLDQDGVLSEGDEPLAGVELRLGPSSAITKEDGSYRLRVPAGEHTWHLAGALPPFTATFIEPALGTTGAEEVQLDIPVVPVVPLEVTLFEDSNRNGVHDPGEPGIAFGGIVIEGADERVLRTSAGGRVTISTLRPGNYTVRVDPARLPPRYLPTGSAVSVTLSEGGQTVRVALGAAPKQREVVTTYGTGSLAVIARAIPATVEAGGELTIEALVSGNPETVSVALGGVELPLKQVGSRWSATLDVPDDAAGSALELVVTARRGDDAVVQDLSVPVK